MSLPEQGTTVGGARLKSLTDMQLQSSQASGTSQDSKGFTTIVPATVIVLATMASGQATMKLKVGTSSSISMASGTTDFAIPPNGSNWGTINTDSTNLFFRLRMTDANWSCAYTNLQAFVLYHMTDGENFTDCRRFYIAVASTNRGDGSGAFTLTPQ